MNKKLIHASAIIAIIWGLINVFVFISAHLTMSYFYLLENVQCYIILLLIAIASFILIFGGIILLHYKDLTEEELKEKEKYIFIWSIYFLIVSPIAGILALISYFLIDYKCKPQRIKVGYIDEIVELDELRKEGLISDKEFELKKKKILDI